MSTTDGYKILRCQPRVPATTGPELAILQLSIHHHRQTMYHQLNSDSSPVVIVIVVIGLVIGIISCIAKCGNALEDDNATLPPVEVIPAVAPENVYPNHVIDAQSGYVAMATSPTYAPPMAVVVVDAPTQAVDTCTTTTTTTA